MLEWLSVISVTSLMVVCLSAVAIIWDLLAGYPQKKPIMNVVWPVTALYAGPLARLAHFQVGGVGNPTRLQSADCSRVGTQTKLPPCFG